MLSQSQAKNTPLDVSEDAPSPLEQLLSEVQASGNDTTRLPTQDKAALLRGLSKALGLNPLSGGVMLLRLNGKETLYVTKVGTDQIAAREKLSRETIVGPEVRAIEGKKVVFCQVRARHPDGRSEMSTATLPLADPVNDLMKCETKAKRRATLSVCGLGLLAEDEIETIQGAQKVDIDTSAQPEPEDDGADGSRAFAAYTEALMTATDATSIRRLYHALVENLRAEGKDPVEFTNGDDGAGALAHKRLDAIGLTLTRDERNALLAFHAPTQPLTEHEGPRVAYWCDAILGAVRAFPEATGDDRVKICATWWLSHRAEAQAETSRVLNMVRAILARVSAGMRVADISPHTSSKAKERLAAAIAELIGQPPPDGPQGGGKPPLKPAPASAQGDTRETTTAPKATAGEAWTRSAEAMRDHLAQQVTDVVHLERSARKHGAAVLATSYGVELYAQRYQALTHDGDSARRLEDCRTAVESWMRAGPVRKAPVIPLRKPAPQPMGRTGT